MLYSGSHRMLVEERRQFRLSLPKEKSEAMPRPKITIKKGDLKGLLYDALSFDSEFLLSELK